MQQMYAERLKEALSMRGWSQAELATRMGVDPGHISRYVTGKIRPQRHNFKRLLDALGMSEQEFLQGAAFKAGEAELELLREVEVLLLLARKLVDGHAKGSEDASGATSDQQQMVSMSYEALAAKVGHIRDVIRPHARAKTAEGQGVTSAE